MRIFFPIIWFLSSFFFFQQVSAQSSIGDTAYKQIALQQVTDFYLSSIGENALIYNGNEARIYSYTAESHPYFGSDKFIKGTVNSNGVLYNDIPLLYDMVNDKLIVLDLKKIFKIEQISESIENFSIYGHEFVRLLTDSISKSRLTTGFYDRLFNGKSVALFAKRQKTVAEILKETHTELLFSQHEYYYIQKNNIYYPVSDKGSVLKVFGDKRMELEKFLKKNKIKFKKQPEYAMTRMAEYYDSLKDYINAK